ncbi:MAG: InlB B-repeat-containing protein [Oscillospiraceae bacterium]|nr:InlB B-repeat-containing protein [Oscillospiraceae bacterium]
MAAISREGTPGIARIVLPSGSTSAQLQAAINAVGAGVAETIEIEGDIAFTTLVTVPAGYIITLLSSADHQVVLSQTISGQRLFGVSGTLTLQDITLDGMDIGGCINVQAPGTLILNDGAILQHGLATTGGGVLVSGTMEMTGGTVQFNNSSTYGGGIYVNTGALLTITGGLIQSNNATVNGGGGIFLSSSATATMASCIVEENHAATNGGGVYVGGSASFTMMSGSILNNVAVTNGGGVYTTNPATGQTNILMVLGGDITGNSAGGFGGGVYVATGTTFTMEAGTIQNNTTVTSGGGGVYLFVSATFVMHGGLIQANTAATNGGGLYLGNSATATMSAGSISGNTSGAIAGGVYVYLNGSFTMTGGDITGNTTNGNGGGIYITATGSAMLENITLSGNGGMVNIGDTTFGPVTNGGGIYLTEGGTLSVLGTSYIVDNTAPLGMGGGIFTEDITYENLLTGDNTFFANNTADGVQSPPEVTPPTIGFASTSVLSSPLNNYDINSSTQEIISFTVFYEPNGGTGSFAQSGLAFGDLYTILSVEETGISRPGFTFGGWNTEPDGSGTSYAPGEQILITENLVLYAQWGGGIFSVIYNANGGTGEHIDSDLPYGSTYTILSAEEAGISRPGFSFGGWNTAPDGSGTTYVPGQQIMITGDLTLYAQWGTGTFTITFDANGGEGSDIVSDIPYGTLFTIPTAAEAGISRPGYAFGGWNTAPDGSGISYFPGQVIEVTGDIILYAQWMPILLTVTYNANGGKGSFTDVGLVFGSEYVILSPQETGIYFENHIFGGWNTAPDGSGTTYQPGDVIVLTEDVTLYAQWISSNEVCLFCCNPCQCVPGCHCF